MWGTPFHWLGSWTKQKGDWANSHLWLLNVAPSQMLHPPRCYGFLHTVSPNQPSLSWFGQVFCFSKRKAARRRMTCFMGFELPKLATDSLTRSQIGFLQGWYHPFHSKMPCPEWPVNCVICVFCEVTSALPAFQETGCSCSPIIYKVPKLPIRPSENHSEWLSTIAAGWHGHVCSRPALDLTKTSPLVLGFLSLPEGICYCL